MPKAILASLLYLYIASRMVVDPDGVLRILRNTGTAVRNFSRALQGNAWEPVPAPEGHGEPALLRESVRLVGLLLGAGSLYLFVSQL